MVSTYDSRREAFDPSGDLKPYTIAKHYSDDYLRNSGLNYTIVHPGLLKDEAGSGKLKRHYILMIKVQSHEKMLPQYLKKL